MRGNVWVQIGGWKLKGEFYLVFRRVWQRVSVKVINENGGWRCMEEVGDYSWESTIRQWSFVHTFSRILFMCLRLSSPTQSPIHGVDGDIMCSCNRSSKFNNSLSPPMCPKMYMCRGLYFLFSLFWGWWPTNLFKKIILPSMHESLSKSWSGLLLLLLHFSSSVVSLASSCSPNIVSGSTIRLIKSVCWSSVKIELETANRFCRNEYFLSIFGLINSDLGATTWQPAYSWKKNSNSETAWLVSYWSCKSFVTSKRNFEFWWNILEQSSKYC